MDVHETNRIVLTYKNIFIFFYAIVLPEFFFFSLKRFVQVYIYNAKIHNNRFTLYLCLSISIQSVIMDSNVLFRLRQTIGRKEVVLMI